MNRAAFVAQLADRETRWDVLVIGGGATGLGAALDAATRGYRTLLLERGDFACGTSSRSTKLIHGGVRYLQQGNIGLVRESLRERALLLRNAPELVKLLPFVVPCHRWWDAPFYGTGLKIYGALSGREAPRPHHLSREETLERLPTLSPCGLRSGELYWDAQFDDAQMAVALAQKISMCGGTPLNYFRVIALNKESGRISGARAEDVETGAEYEIRARVVINATGVFSDAVRRLDDANAAPMLVPSQGAHVVLPANFLPGETALMVPRTDDGRVLFAIPWLGRVLVGTTDTAVHDVKKEPQPLDAEIDFLLNHAARYFSKPPARSDILSAFAGLRPLVKRPGIKATSRLARDHIIEVSSTGLLTITGGKWTTFRKMAEDAIDTAAKIGGFVPRHCTTKNLPLEARAPARMERDEPLHESFPYRVSDVLHAARNEMARTVEDVLARRTRALFLDARASMNAAPRVAELLATELGRDARWEREQVELFYKTARGYCVG